MALAVTYVLSAGTCLAHDDADWIRRNPDYSSQIGQHCCGPKDCFRIASDLVFDDGKTITYLPTQQRFRRGTRRTYLSETDDYWICESRQFRGFSAPRAICIFHPFHSQ